MPANFNPANLKTQITTKVAQLRALLDESAVYYSGGFPQETKELTAARLGLDEVLAHAINHIDRNWTV